MMILLLFVVVVYVVIDNKKRRKGETDKNNAPSEPQPFATLTRTRRRHGAIFLA